MVEEVFVIYLEEEEGIFEEKVVEAEGPIGALCQVLSDLPLQGEVKVRVFYLDDGLDTDPLFEGVLSPLPSGRGYKLSSPHIGGRGALCVPTPDGGWAIYF